MAGKSNILKKVLGQDGKLWRILRQLPGYLPSRSWRRSSRLLAIDVTSNALKLMQLSKQGKNYRVDYYTTVLLPKDAIVENEIKQPKVLIAVLQRALVRTGQKARYVITALPSSMTMTKKLLVPATYDDEVLAEHVYAAAEKVIPYSLDDLSLDYVMQGDSINDPGKMDVLLVASQNSNLEARLEVFEEAGLEIKILDVASYALCRAVNLIVDQIPGEIYTQGKIAVFDIGTQVTQMTVISQKNLLYTQEEFFGGEQLTEKIQEHYHLSYEQAECSKLLCDLPEDYLQKLLEPFKKATMHQVEEMLQSFYSSSSHNNVDFIVLAGEVALTQGLAEMISHQLKIATVVADPCAVLKLNNCIDEKLFNASSPALMSLLGLAMRGADI